MTTWRTLPEFPDYQITDDGDIRNKWTLKKINEVQNKKTGAWSYSLRRPDGRSTCRSYEGLIHSAFPELKPEPEEQPVKSTRSYAKRGLWKNIPEFPTYDIHPDGLVRYVVSRRFRQIDKINDVDTVLLFNEAGQHRRTIKQLISDVFPELKEAS